MCVPFGLLRFWFVWRKFGEQLYMVDELGVAALCATAFLLFDSSITRSLLGAWCLRRRLLWRCWHLSLLRMSNVLVREASPRAKATPQACGLHRAERLRNSATGQALWHDAVWQLSGDRGRQIVVGSEFSLLLRYLVLHHLPHQWIFLLCLGCRGGIVFV